MFSGGSPNAGTPPGERPNAEGVFADVFEEVCTGDSTVMVSKVMIFYSFYAQKLSVTLLGGPGSALFVGLALGS